MCAVKAPGNRQSGLASRISISVPPVQIALSTSIITDPKSVFALVALHVLQKATVICGVHLASIMALKYLYKTV